METVNSVKDLGLTEVQIRELSLSLFAINQDNNNVCFYRAERKY